LETHSSSEISAAIRRVERRDQAADKAVNEPEEGRRPSQQGHVNEHVSDGEQKVQTHRARPLQPTLRSVVTSFWMLPRATVVPSENYIRAYL
jgi:hypothetical protein